MMNINAWKADLKAPSHTGSEEGYDQWPRDKNGELIMYAQPLDFDSLRRELIEPKPIRYSG
jgi:hypothetical protein